LEESPPYTYRAQEEAFAIAPNPHVASAMRRLCHDDEPRLVSLALDVLRARGEVEFGAPVPLLEHSHEEVRVSAVRALGCVGERSAAVELLTELCETEIDDDV